MGKRKRNQASAPVTDRSTGQTDHKKPKVESSLPKKTQLPKSQNSQQSETGAAPTSDLQTTSADAPPEVAQDGKSLTKFQLKRQRQMQKRREAKKAARIAENPISKESSNDAGQSVSETKAPTSTVKSGSKHEQQISEPKVSKKKTKKSKPLTSETSKAVRDDIKVVQTQPTSAPDLPAVSGKEASKETFSGNKAKTPAIEKPTASRDATDGRLSKKKKRRQKLHARRKSDIPLDNKSSLDDVQQAPDGEIHDRTSTATAVSDNNKEEQDRSLPTSLLQKVTGTRLLLKPQKQWIKEEDSNPPKADEALHEKVTQTTLLPRPTKQWVQEDEPLADDAATESSQNQSPEPQSNLIRQTGQVESRAALQGFSDVQDTTSSPSDDDEPNKEERSFAKVGLPTTTTSPATRPGIKTIASFSFSSRRHPADVLSNTNKSSGLSGLRKDAGSFGGYAKPMSSLKANSVPSYSSRGDVKAAFQRFNNFAHKRDELDSDEDSEDSEESDSEMEVEEVKVGNKLTSAPENVAPSQSSLAKLDEAKALSAENESGSAEEADSIEEIPTEEPEDDTNNAAESADSLHEETSSPKELAQGADDAAENPTHSTSETSESEEGDESDRDEDNLRQDSQPQHAETAQSHTIEGQALLKNEETSQQDTANTAIPSGTKIEGEADLPLFSEFNARYSDQPTNTDRTRSGSFLGQDLGGNPGGAGATDDPSSANNLLEDRDDLFRSIDEVSRDVFGATRALPDCKPLSTSSDPLSEPPVTDNLSNHCLKKILDKNGTPEKANALNDFVRGSSPVVWIVNTEEVGNGVVLDNIRHRAESSSPASSLSSLSRSPTPPNDSNRAIDIPADSNDSEAENRLSTQEENADDKGEFIATPVRKKRKMTGTTSKHFSPQKSLPKIEEASPAPLPVNSEEADEADLRSDPLIEPTNPLKAKRPSKKQTGTKSTFFTPTNSPTKPTNPPPSTTKKTPRPTKGTSTSLVPPTTSAHFGLIQEKLWTQPFWLIIAVTFLNKTTGRAAAPIFWTLKTLYPTPLALSRAKEPDLVALITTLGLQNQRAKRLISIAKVWLETPPEKSLRYRTLHYPSKNDGKSIPKDTILDSDSDFCAGALEIGHIPGCGPYAWDSWRIFCRDVTRGLADDYNGKNAVEGEGFEPEWRRVLPLDKELRACLRWMWLREGWVWDPVTGERRVAGEGEREEGVKGQMVLEDEAERRFAREAAFAGEGEEEVELGNEGGESDVLPQPQGRKRKRPRGKSIASRELDVESEDGAEDDASPAKRATRSSRSKRARRAD